MRLVIPENLKEITVVDYQKYSNIVDSTDDSPEFLILKMVEIFCNIKQRDVFKIPVFELEATAELLTKAFESPRSFTQKFTHNGVEYGFIPKLDDMSYAEYMDLSNYLNDDSNLHRFMAVCYRPIEEDVDDMYSIQEYGGSNIYADQMLSAPVEIGLEARVFFYRLAKELMDSMKDSLTHQEMTRMKDLLAQRKRLAIGGVGIKHSTP